MVFKSNKKKPKILSGSDDLVVQALNHRKKCAVEGGVVKLLF